MNRQTKGRPANVRVLLYEPHKPSRSNMKRILIAEDYTNLMECGTFEEAENALANDEFDLFMASLGDDPASVCKLVHNLRRGPEPLKRFTVVLGILLDSATDRIKGAIDAGFDALLVKPISLGTLQKRLDYFANTRKPFVVTRDYIGPDRRANPRSDGHQIPLIQAPNPVQLMSEGATTRQQLTRMAEKVSAQLDDQSAFRGGHELVWLARNIMGKHLQNKQDKEYAGWLRDLVAVSGEMPDRLRKSRYGHAQELCVQMNGLAKKIMAKATDPQQKDMQLLPELAQAIEKSFGPA